mmetsp:Transcript_99410/g.281488  ORF Transcript_99410/g.281488 Transcript_99410/m.281488 type:complete len:110 (+) Transcript_99410:95-424(+)
MSTFEVRLYRPLGALLGIDVMVSPLLSFRGLFILKISEGGLVAAWNQCNRGSVQIQPGDVIVRVNDKGGDTSAIVAELRTCDRLHIEVRCGHADPAPPAAARAKCAGHD